MGTANMSGRGRRQSNWQRRGLLILLLLAAIIGCKDGITVTTPGDNTGNTPPNPNLPAEVQFLASGFAIEKVAGSLNVPAKMAFAPDGRLFFNELRTGKIRVIGTDGQLDPQPWAHITVLNSGENGLIGLAFSPTFAVDGFVFAVACVPGPDRQQVIRFTEVGGVGTFPTVIVDHLPQGTIHNSGDIQFLADGTFIVSIGDTGDSALSQQDGALAGRILRYTAAGGIPTDNPNPASAEYCRGLRNSFDMAINPTTSGIFATENGPTAHDELNFIQPGKNFEWETLPSGFPGAQVGLKLFDWAEVIAPTGIAIHPGTGIGSEYANDIFLAAYVDAEVLVLPMSGAAFTDVDSQSVLVKFVDSGNVDNKPLDLAIAADGSLYISTFTAIWRVTKP